MLVVFWLQICWRCKAAGQIVTPVVVAAHVLVMESTKVMPSWRVHWPRKIKVYSKCYGMRSVSNTCIAQFERLPSNETTVEG